jgi:F-type H+-transporting ATPase subunit c
MLFFYERTHAMNKPGVFRRATVVAVLALALVAVFGTPVLFAQEGAPAAAASGMSLAYFGAAVGLGMIVIGAGLGIGRFAAAAAEGIARQPAAADKITGAVNLPLFLLEGVAIIAEVGVLLIVLTK